ncbi:MAG: ferrous iron transport protein A [Candidatus Omnitrophica bacterium]|nr:ferrous iron transport protein A [Candidatus Omnitrophota bacterium]
MIVSLVDMKQGESGTIADLRGGHGFTMRIQSMGVYVGKRVKKVGSGFFRGPQTVLIDKYQIAIGYGMASKIFVEVDR